MRKLFALATITGIALAAPLMASAPAMADDQPLITVGEGACVAPWYWEGPLDIITNVDGYSACNGPQAPHPTGSIAGALDGSCLLPWHWKGPGNVLTGLLTDTSTQATQYTACNSAP
jgi:hypothetical protein